ncbi:MAG: family protein phosphatase [Actinomycetota bacterium]|nr:family protein phosphatase [Actinomycetota bacterium]
MTTLRAGAATDVGRVRQINEDRYLCDESLFAVADGVGGHQAGEVAAQTAVETLRSAFIASTPAGLTTDGLVDAVQDANEAVWRLAQTASEKRGMGTTMTAVGLVQEDGEELLALVNVGDSRIYRLQNGELLQLTDDHSLVEEMVREGKLTREEAGVHPQRSIITRALGMEPEIEVDWWELIPYRGDRLLLCSDGLTNELSDDRIAATLRQVADPKEAARDLVRQARAEGGGDNITVVVVDVVDDDGRAEEASEALAKDHVLAGSPGVRAPVEGDRARSPGGGPASPAAATPTPTIDDDDIRTMQLPRADLTLATSRRDLKRGDVRSRPAGEASPTPVPPGRPPPPAKRAGPRRFTWRVAGFLVLLVAVVLGTLAAIGWYARSTYYVGFAGDQVAIYKGRPGGVLWFRPTLRERKPLTRAEVPGAFLPALEKGKEVDSKAEADRYVTNLRDIHAREEQEKTSPSTTTTAPTTGPSSTLPSAPPPPP